MHRNSEFINQDFSTRHTLFDPVDFVLEPSQISTLSCPSVQTDFEFVVDGRSYKCNKSLARTIFTHVNEQLSSHPETDKIILRNIQDPNCYFQLIQCMMAGEVITINEDNAFFLNYIASSLGNEELRSKTEIFISRYKINVTNMDNNNNNFRIEGEFLPAKWYQVLLKLMLNFFSNISIIFRIFLFLCELIGFAIGVAFIFNLFMVPLTSGIISLNMKDIFRYGLMIPYFLFNINIVSLVEIITFYICKSNHFILNSPLSKHIQLLKLIKAVWPFCNKAVEVQFSAFELSMSPLIHSNHFIKQPSKSFSNPNNSHSNQQYMFHNISENNSELNLIQSAQSNKKQRIKFFFFSGRHNIYNTILGFLLLLFVVLLVLTDFFRYFIIFFSVILPTILIASVFVLYSILALLSAFPKGRSNFITYGDFSDPFVDSMFFSDSKWTNFFTKAFSSCKYSTKKLRPSLSLPITSNSNSLGNYKEDDEEPINQSTSFPFCCQSKSLFIYFCQAVFSKSTAGFLVSVGILSLLIVERKSFNASQILLIIFLIIFLLNPLMCSINFPFLTIQRFFSPVCSETQVKLQDKWMNSSTKRIKWLNLWFTWSKDATPIRVSRIIFVLFFILAVIGSIFPATIFRQDDIVGPGTNSSFTSHVINESYYRNIVQSNNKSIYLMNPVCDIHVRDLTITQLSAIAESSYQIEDDDPTLHLMLRVFFGDNWNETLKIQNDAPKSKFAHSNVRHFIYKDNLHIISIRGTANTVDVLADIELWASSFVMNILSSSIPIFNGYTTSQRTFLGYAMHLPRYMFKPFSLINGYIEIITNFVNTIQLGNGTEIVLTGHSLGGGLSKLVSTMTGYRAISYSGPGIQALNSFYEWKDEHIIQSFINVVPNLDPVAGVDQATGSSFLIPCNAGMFACHDIIRTMCMLATLCMDRMTIQTYSFCLENLGNESMKSITKDGRPYHYNS